MDAVRVHLVLNHAPLFWISFGLLLFLFGMIKKNRTIMGAAIFAFLLSALTVIFVYLSGHGAEEVVEHLPGISEEYLEKHEEAAEIAFYTTIILGISSLIALFLIFIRKTEDLLCKAFVILTLLLSLGAIGTLAAAGSYGGKIRHTELIGGKQVQNQIEAGEEHEEH